VKLDSADSAGGMTTVRVTFGARGPFISVLVHFSNTENGGLTVERLVEGQTLIAEDQLLYPHAGGSYNAHTRTGQHRKPNCCERPRVTFVSLA